MVDSIYGYTMLMIKVEEGNLREVSTIRKRYPNEDINIQNKAGQTALTLAARGGFPDIAEYLIQQGADVNVQNKSGQTPLFVACWYNNAHVVDVLLSYNADANIADSRGWTPIIAACHNNNLEIVKLLLKTEPDVRSFDCFGKRARERAKNSKIIKLVGELERKQDLIEDPEFFADSPRSGRRKSMIRRNSKRSTSRKSNSKTPKRFTFGSPDRTPKSRDVSWHRSPSRGRDASVSDDLSPLRTAPQFIHGLEYFKPYDTAGSYKKARSKSKKAKKLFGSDNETLKKFTQQEKSVDNLTEIHPSPRSQSGYDTLGETLNVLRTPKTALKTKPRYSCANTGEKQYHGKGEDEFGVSSSMRMSELGRDTHYTSNPESFYDSMRSFNRTREEVDNLLRKSKEVPFSLKSVGSLASTERTNFKSGYKSRSDIGSLDDLSIMKGDDDDVLSSKLKGLFKLFIKNLYDRMHTALDKGVAEGYTDEMDRFGKITEEKFHQIIMERGGKITEKVISSFQDLLEALMRDFNLGKDLSKTLEEGTEMLIRNMTADAENEMYQHVLRGVNGPYRNTLPNRSLNKSAWEKVQMGSSKDGHNDFLKTFKKNAMDQLNEIFTIVDDALLDKPRHQKGKLSYLACQEVLEGLNNIKSNVKELLEDEFSSSKFKTQPIVENSDKSTQTNLAAHHQRAAQTFGTSTLSDRFSNRRLSKDTEELISDSQGLSRTSSKKSLAGMSTDVLNIMIQPSPSNSNKVLNASKWTSFKIPTKSYESQGNSNRSLNDSYQESNQSFSSLVNNQEQENKRKYREKIQNNKAKLPLDLLRNDASIVQNDLKQKKEGRNLNQDLMLHKRELTFGPEVQEEIRQKTKDLSFDNHSSIDNSPNNRSQDRENKLDKIDDKLSLSVNTSKDFAQEEIDQEVGKIGANTDLSVEKVCDKQAVEIENAKFSEDREKELSEKESSVAEKVLDQVSEMEELDEILITKDKMRNTEWLENDCQLESVIEDLNEEKAEERNEEYKACDNQEAKVVLDTNTLETEKAEEIVKPELLIEEQIIKKDESLENSVESESSASLEDDLDKVEVDDQNEFVDAKTSEKEEINESVDIINKNQELKVVQSEETQEVIENVEEGNEEKKDEIPITEIEEVVNNTQVQQSDDVDKVNVEGNKDEIEEIKTSQKEEVAGSVDINNECEIVEDEKVKDIVNVEENNDEKILEEKDDISIHEVEDIVNNTQVQQSDDVETVNVEGNKNEVEEIKTSQKEEVAGSVNIESESDQDCEIVQGEETKEVIENVQESNKTILDEKDETLIGKTEETENNTQMDAVIIEGNKNEVEDIKTFEKEEIADSVDINTKNQNCEIVEDEKTENVNESIEERSVSAEDVDQKVLDTKDITDVDDVKEAQIDVVETVNVTEELNQNSKPEAVIERRESDELVEIGDNNKENEVMEADQINSIIDSLQKDEHETNIGNEPVLVQTQDKRESAEEEIIQKNESFESSVESESSASSEDNLDKAEVDNQNEFVDAKTSEKEEINESADNINKNQEVEILQSDETQEILNNAQENNDEKVLKEKGESLMDEIEVVVNNTQVQQSDDVDKFNVEGNKNEAEDIKTSEKEEVADFVNINNENNNECEIVEDREAKEVLDNIEEGNDQEKDEIPIAEIEEAENNTQIQQNDDTDTVNVEGNKNESEEIKPSEKEEVADSVNIESENNQVVSDEETKEVVNRLQETELELCISDERREIQLDEISQAKDNEQTTEPTHIGVEEINQGIDDIVQTNEVKKMEESEHKAEEVEVSEDHQIQQNKNDLQNIHEIEDNTNSLEEDQKTVGEIEETKETEKQISYIEDVVQQPVFEDVNGKETMEVINEAEKVKKEEDKSNKIAEESDDEIDEFNAEKEGFHDQMDQYEDEGNNQTINNKKGTHTLEIIVEEEDEENADNKQKKETDVKQSEVVDAEDDQEDSKLLSIQNLLANVPQDIAQEEIQTLTDVNQELEEQLNCEDYKVAGESKDLLSVKDEKIEDQERVEPEDFGRQQQDEKESCEEVTNEVLNKQNDKEGRQADDQVVAEEINRMENENIQERIVLPEFDDSREELPDNNKQNIEVESKKVPESLTFQLDSENRNTSSTKASIVSTLPSVQTVNYLDNYRIPHSPDSPHSSDGMSDFDRVFKTFDDVMYKPKRNNVMPSEPILEKPSKKDQKASNNIENIESKYSIVSTFPSFQLNNYLDSYKISDAPSSPHSSEGESDFDSIYKTFDSVMYKPDLSNLAPSEPVKQKPMNYDIGYNAVDQSVSQKLTSGDVDNSKKAIMGSRLVVKNIHSFTQNAGFMIPTPTPSRFVVKTVNSSIDNIPHSKKFETPGQTEDFKGLPLKTIQKEYVETHVITKEWSM